MTKDELYTKGRRHDLDIYDDYDSYLRSYELILKELLPDETIHYVMSVGRIQKSHASTWLSDAVFVLTDERLIYAGQQSNTIFKFLFFNNTPVYNSDVIYLSSIKSTSSAIFDRETEKILIHTDKKTTLSLFIFSTQKADKYAQQIMHEINELKKTRHQGYVNSAFSVADEIKKLKTLRDEGIISEEEFQRAKTNLINFVE